MLDGDSARLLSAMSQYGYSLLAPERMPEPNELLAALARSGDARVLEGFPVVLAYALEKRPGVVDLGAAEALIKDPSVRERFRRLTALALYLFRVFGLSGLAPAGAETRLERGGLLAQLRASMEEGRPFEVGGKAMDLARVKRTFLRYFVEGTAAEEGERKARLREEFRREFHLSLFFAPRQRDLVEKRLRGEPLTKTEREYFSRVVKKKLLALADPDLHRLALKALQER